MKLYGIFEKDGDEQPLGVGTDRNRAWQNARKCSEDSTISNSGYICRAISEDEFSDFLYSLEKQLNG